MKRHLILITLLFIPILIFAQTKKEIALYYGKSTGTASFSVLRTGFLLGASSSKLDENNSIGLRFSTGIKDKPRLKIETGINYLAGDLIITPAPVGDPIHDVAHIETFSLISIPFYFNHTLGKYFFINEGLLLDIQNVNSNTYKGFGGGFGVGIGAKYELNNLSFYINPKFERHLFLSKKYGLIELGIMFGAGYKF